MTLSTYVYIDGPVDHREVYDKVNEILHIKDPVFTDEESEYDEGVRRIDNALGQGFDAWVMTSSRYDGQPMIREGDPDEAEEDPDSRWAKDENQGYVKVNFDTAYGFNERGYTCTTLHASVVVDLGKWLQERGVTWRWVNEYTGEIHAGFEGLDDFVGSGEQARDWFQNMALPAIKAMGFEV